MTAAPATAGPGWRAVAVWVVAVAALNFARQLPEVHSLDALVFGDPGLALSVDALLDEGKTPTVDFAYFYGLLGVLIDRAWFALVGRTAAADTALLALGNLLVALGMARFARAVDLPPSARWLLLAGVPFAVMPLRYTSPSHAFDAALIVHALAFQARGNLRAAFAVAVTGVFVKSALASVYAAGLLGLIAFGPRPTPAGWRQRVRDLIPGAVVGFAIVALLAARFGWLPLLKTMFPLAGAKTYAGGQFGFFFGIGRRFWLPDQPSPAFYLFGPAGFWLLASVVMLAGIPGLVRARRDPRALAVLACVALHLAFVFLLFGNEQSWLYYSFLPVLGACGVAGRWEASGTGSRWLLPGLTVVAVCGWVGFFGYGIGLWKQTVRTDATGGLFARPRDAAAWERVRDLATGHRVLVLTPSGAARVLFPELDSVRSSALLPAVAPTVEVETLLAQLKAANVVVIHQVTGSLFEEWPPFAAELAQFEEDAPTSGEAGFRVYRRRGVERTGGGK